MTSLLHLESWTMPAAELGPENPLPPISGLRELHVTENADPAVPAEMLQNMAYGHLPNILPYSSQDGYTRERQPRQFRVAVLENDVLRATFLLELGGRLWSLFHKLSQRELLSVNSVFQPANLALRNAWFSGGVEWNIGTIGHSPFTCSPLFAARAQGPEGTPVLRLYEWERIRQVAFQIDAWLPEGSPVLFVRVGIYNSHDHAVPMYWWSNIAVPETPDTRLVVPADSAYRYVYDRLNVIPVPEHEGVDNTYAAKIHRSADFFFHLPVGQRPWITALDGQGRGLVQVSTDRLIGRKLFVWGMGRGGRKWQEFLSVPGQAYIEIQAGLARTQMEHLPMPAKAEWTWLEAYGLLEAEAEVVHGSDWGRACRSVDSAIEKLIPRSVLEAELVRSSTFAVRPPLEIIHRGSGWGALEGKRRAARSEPSFCPTGLVFDDESLGTEQEPWLELLYQDSFPASDPAAEPHGFMVAPEWRDLLEKAVEKDASWFAWLHLGVMRHYADDGEGARQAWEHSLVLERTPWALRNLGAVALRSGQADRAAEFYISALRLHPGLLPLAAECGKALLEAGQFHKWLELLSELPVSIRRKGRIRLLEAQAALATDDLERVGSILGEKPVVDDLREGERSLSHLWFEYQGKRVSKSENVPVTDRLLERVHGEFPVPPELDFRMSED